MVECTTFADVIKYKGGNWQSVWHFDDQPYMDEGGKPSDFNYTKPEHNVTEAINGIVDWFNAAEGYDKSPIFDIMTKNGPSGHTMKDAWSQAMRLLLHYVGDSHQPLHGETRLDKEYPNGDRGGNDFPLITHIKVKNLHSVWDKVVYEFHTNPKLPFTADAWTLQETQVEKLLKDHPVSSLNDVKNLDPFQWQKETFEIASTFAYINIKEGEALPEEYITKGVQLAEKQIVTAGYRLANLLKSLTHLKQMPELDTIMSVPESQPVNFTQ